jgi:hypothetical protein
MYEPIVVRESAPMMTPPSYATAMIDVCRSARSVSARTQATLAASSGTRSGRYARPASLPLFACGSSAAAAPACSNAMQAHRSGEHHVAYRALRPAMRGTSGSNSRRQVVQARKGSACCAGCAAAPLCGAARCHHPDPCMPRLPRAALTPRSISPALRRAMSRACMAGCVCRRCARLGVRRKMRHERCRVCECVRRSVMCRRKRGAVQVEWSEECLWLLSRKPKPRGSDASSVHCEPQGAARRGESHTRAARRPKPSHLASATAPPCSSCLHAGHPTPDAQHPQPHHTHAPARPACAPRPSHTSASRPAPAPSSPSTSRLTSFSHAPRVTHAHTPLPRLPRLEHLHLSPRSLPQRSRSQPWASRARSSSRRSSRTPTVSAGCGAQARTGGTRADQGDGWAGRGRMLVELPDGAGGAAGMLASAELRRNALAPGRWSAIHCLCESITPPELLASAWLCRAAYALRLRDCC